MKRTLVLLGTCVLVTLTLVALLWRRDQTLDAYARQVESALAANRRLAREIGTVRATTTAATISMKPQDAGTAPRAAMSASTGVGRDRAFRDALLHSPEYAPYIRQEHQRRAMSEYGEWFATLKVSPERLAMIKQAIADYIATGQDSFEAAIAAGYRMGTREFEELIIKYGADAQARLREVLAPEEFASYKTYENVKWFMVLNLQSIREMFGERAVAPLSGDQVVPLAVAWQQAMRWKPADPMKVGALARAQREKFLDYAGATLNPQQLAALADYVHYENTKGQRLGQLLQPDDPDGAVHSMNVSRY